MIPKHLERIKSIFRLLLLIENGGACHEAFVMVVGTLWIQDNLIPNTDINAALRREIISENLFEGLENKIKETLFYQEKNK